MNDSRDTQDKAVDLLPVEVAGIVGGVARRVPGPTGKAADSMLAVYQHRLTYTFILHKQVASIHFDSKRGEIFFRGRNAKFMTLEQDHIRALCELVEIMARDRQAKKLLPAYRETLAGLMADT